MNILILGNGARERAVKEKIHDIYNRNVFIYNNTNFSDITEYCNQKDIHFVIPTSEIYLCKGIKNYLFEYDVFGPYIEQARIEGSKIFAKKLMRDLEIPTPNFVYFRSLQTVDYTKVFKNPVLKYSGLASGKGVFLPLPEDINYFMEELFNLGDEGVVVEERLHGKEVSVMAFCNGNEAFLMPQSQDYKRINDQNEGANTGGMGAICPCNILSNSDLTQVKHHMDNIVKNLKYVGILYAGLMKTDNGVYFLEFNCRFGDPETQVVLNLLENDLIRVMVKCMKGEKLDLKWKQEFASCVVLSHEDYPFSKVSAPVNIHYGNLDNTVKLYESNVIPILDKKYTTGGRVMSMISVDRSLNLSLQNIYNNIYKIYYPGIYYRRDIGSNNNIPDYSYPNIGILSSGNGTCLEYIYGLKCIKFIASNKKTCGIEDKAKLHNIPFMYHDFKSQTDYENLVNVMRIYKVKVVILAGYNKIVPDILYKEFYTVNIHPSLLPRYKGLYDIEVHQNVLKNKDNFSGCTLHRVTEEVDGGRIILQKQYKLLGNESEYNLRKNVQSLEKLCILEFIQNYNEKIDYDIDIEQGNQLVNSLKYHISNIDNFCASYNLNGIELAASADGCGTKLDLANIYNKLDTIGIDLVAMNVNDLIAGGARPLFFMDYIAVDKMDKLKCKKIIDGILEGCEHAECKLIGGETAEMKGIYLKNKCDLAGFAVGQIICDLPKKKMMNEHCYVYGFKSTGIHSNGYTLVKELLEKSNKHPSIDDIMEPTKIYYEVVTMLSLYSKNIFGIAHITGGGFADNISRILPEYLELELYDWDFPPIFKWIQNESKLTKKEMLSTFNCGYGMVIITDKKFFNLDVIGRLKQI